MNLQAHYDLEVARDDLDERDRARGRTVCPVAAFDGDAPVGVTASIKGDLLLKVDVRGNASRWTSKKNTWTFCKTSNSPS